MGLLEDTSEALGHMVREEGQRNLLQPELLPCSEVLLVAGSDALSSLWLLDHLFRIAIFKLFMQGSLLLFASPPLPKLWDGWLPHSLALIVEITDYLFHKASRANRAASAGAVLQEWGKREEKWREMDRRQLEFFSAL